MPYFTTSDDCRIHYETFGFEAEKPAVAFLNGTAQSALQWRPQALQFRARFRVVLYDGRAQGRSDPGSAPLSAERHALDLRELLLHLNTARAHMVGLSHGAHVALALAAHHPECVERMVLCSLGAEMSAFARAAVRSWLEVLRRCGLEPMAWATVPVVLGEGYLKRNEMMLGKISAALARRNRPEALQMHLRALLKYPPPAEYAVRHHHPTLVISGSEDPLVAPRNAARLAVLCQGRCSTVEGAGHSLPVEEPEGFNRMVEAFLLGLTAG